MRSADLRARRQVGVPTSTVRYYERVGLLAIAGRTASGYRDYDEDDAARLLFVTRAPAGWASAASRSPTCCRSGTARTAPAAHERVGRLSRGQAGRDRRAHHRAGALRRAARQAVRSALETSRHRPRVEPTWRAVSRRPAPSPSPSAWFPRTSNATTALGAANRRSRPIRRDPWCSTPASDLRQGLDRACCEPAVASRGWGKRKPPCFLMEPRRSPRTGASLRVTTRTPCRGASSRSPSTPSTIPRLLDLPAYRMPMRSITARVS